jgi:hypothetical protein
MIDHIDHQLRNTLTAALGAALHEASRTDYALDGIDILGARFGAALRRGWDSAAPSASEPAPDAIAKARRDERQRCIAIARGCVDYSGGHSGDRLTAYHHGMDTVVNVLSAPESDRQAQVVESMGRVTEPATPPATIATLRARVRELEAQVKSVETADDPRDGVCLTGDGVRYGVHMTPGLFGALCVTLEGRDGETKIACVIPRVDILAALGIRGDL